MLGDHFRLTRFDVYVILGLIAYIVLALRNKLPQVESIRKFTAAFDDRGGNILILSLFSSWFFATAIRLFYYAMTLISNGKIDAKDAVLLMALQFATGVAFGGAFGALLKTFRGDMTVAPPFADGTPSPPQKVETPVSGGTP